MNDVNDQIHALMETGLRHVSTEDVMNWHRTPGRLPTTRRRALARRRMTTVTNASALSMTDEQPERHYVVNRLRHSRWLPGMAAAAAVIAVAASAVAIRTVAAQRGNAPGAETMDGLPPYYSAITVLNGTHRRVAIVGAIRTGAVLATVRPPDGSTFITAAGGPGDQSFLLEARLRDNRIGIYLLRFNPANHSATLSGLPLPPLDQTSSVAMSPSGTEVAVSTTARTTAQLRIYTRSGMLIRQWRDPGVICHNAGLPCLSWTSSGYLAFDYASQGNDINGDGIRLIQASTASGGLVEASHLVLPSKTALFANLSFLISGDARTIDGLVWTPHMRPPYRFERLSVPTARVTNEFRPLVGTAWWSDQTGSTLIVSAVVSPTGRSGARPVTRYGVLTSRSFTPLRLGETGAWSDLAF